MRFWILVIASILMLAAAGGQSSTPTKPSLDEFLGDFDFWSPELSPSGRYVAGVRQVDDSHFIIVADLERPLDETLEGVAVGDYFVNWLDWATNDRLLLSVTGYINLNNGDVITREQLRDRDFLARRSVSPVPITRLIAMDRDGRNHAVMFGDDRRMNRNFSLGRVASFLRDDPDHILMSASRRGDYDLFRVNVNSGEAEPIALGTGRTYYWYVDRNGEPAFRYDSNRRGTVVTIYSRQDRADGKIRWRKFKTLRRKRDDDRSDAATDFTPLSAGPTPTTYYVAARPDGEDTTGVYLYDFESDAYVETLAALDGVDIETAFFARDTGEFQGVAYFDHKLELKVEDTNIQAHLNGLGEYFGDQTNVFPMQSSGNGQIWLLWTTGPLDAGSYHVYDTEKAFVRPIGFNRHQLASRLLAPTQVVEYIARDGLELHGYLTRPANTEPGEKPPLIVMPHGGPEARDTFDFDLRVQILAAKGYQVFQPNFRGSSGFGREFADRGRRQWGRAMQTDIEDGYAHLVSSGLAEDGRACIVGASYGGYAALAAATLTPGLYECVVSIAGISDLNEMLKRERREEGRRSEAYEYWVKHIGDPRSDREAIDAVSPALLAERVTEPILLIHGERDRIVWPEQSEYMRDALTKAGKRHVYIELEESGHSFRGDEDERREYEAILGFLAEHLPPDRTVAEAN